MYINGVRFGNHTNTPPIMMRNDIASHPSMYCEQPPINLVIQQTFPEAAGLAPFPPFPARNNSRYDEKTE